MYYNEDKPRIKKVFLYTRKSTDESSGKQLRSIEDQREDCILLAKKYNLEIVKEFTDSASAHVPNNRPNFNAMLKELQTKNPQKRRADGILAWHPDRIVRNALEAGVVLQLIDDEYIKDMFFVAYMFHNDSSGKEHLFMEFARAKGYSDKLSDVVLRGMKKREATGALMYGGKFGYDKLREDPKNPKRCSLFPIPDSTDFPVIRAVFQQRRLGKTINDIRAYLKKNELLTANGIVPSKQSISGYLNDTFYYGQCYINKDSDKVREVDFRAITAPDGTKFIPAVSEEHFWECQRIHSGDVPKPQKRKLGHPLRGGFLTCSNCKEHLYPASRMIKWSGGREEAQLGYECHTKGCDAKPRRIKAETVFTAIEESLKGGLGLTEKEHHQFIIKTETFAVDRRRERKAKRRRLTETMNCAERDLEALEAEKAALVRQEQYDEDAETRIEKRKKVLKDELLSYREEQKETDQQFEDDLFTFESFLELSTNAHRYWAAANPDQKHRIAVILLLNLTIDSGVVQSITYKEPFAKWLNRDEIHNGGYART